MPSLLDINAIRIVVCVWSLLGACIQQASSLKFSECRTALGMQSGDIPDSALSASSSYDMSSVGPASARIRLEIKGGAWCPMEAISKDMYEYLQVDFDEMMVITLVETQGRFGRGQGQEYVEQYILEYQREDGGQWFRYRSRRNQELIPGNGNTYMTELRELDPPIILKRIRFLPYSSTPKTVCMRVELYGCPWTDGVVSYSMRQGERRGTEIDLYDFTYDGRIEDTQLSGGLGQLTDGVEGNRNFRLLSQGVKGYDWVGWRNETGGVSQPVEIVFKFDAVRNFTLVRVHCNNMHSKDVSVFRNATVHFSVGGEYYQPDPLHFVYMKDNLIEFARYAIIPLGHRVGKYVKLQMAFASRWIMISEVQFESETVDEVIPVEIPPPTTPPAVPETNPQPLVPAESGRAGAGEGAGAGAGAKPPGTKRVRPQPGEDKTINNKLNSRQISAPDSSGGTVAQNNDSVTTTAGAVVNTYKGLHRLDERRIGMIIGVLTALILLLISVIIIIVIRHRRHKLNNNHRAMKIIAAHHQNISSDFSTGIVNHHSTIPPNGIVYNYTALNDNDLHKTAPLDDHYGGDVYVPTPHANGRATAGGAGDAAGFLPMPHTPGSTDTNTSREYAVPDITRSSFAPPTYPRSLPVSPITSPPPQEGPYLTTTLPHALAAPLQYSDAAPGLADMQSVSGGNVYTVLNPEQEWPDDAQHVMEIPREALTFVEKLGQGQFGEVHLCEARGLANLCCDPELPPNAPVMVAVKTLTQNADQAARSDFQKEMEIMSRLQDPNIVRVLGMCSVGEPLCVVVEYMYYGDLHQYLRKHVGETATLSRKARADVLSYGSLIYIATQIASGMKYLESLNMVHRDLATRNCLVGTSYTIKIADFGMSRNLYSEDYYRVEGKAVLPIRWMAWESVILGKFSCKSDMWSFGVTLWEILTFAREQPLDSMTDEQVVDNCTHYYRADNMEQRPPQPIGCPKEIYDMMCTCWSREDANRPTFREIHMFLANKNQGFDPNEEKYGHMNNARQATLPLYNNKNRQV